MNCIDAFSWCPTVQNCCCCHSLGLGSKIIGWVLLISSILNITEGALAVGGHGGGMGLGSIALSSGILSLIASILLLIGLYFETPILVKVWIILEFIILFLAAMSIILMIVYLAQGKEDSNYTITTTLVPSIFVFMLKVYFFIVVYSFYTEGY